MRVPTGAQLRELGHQAEQRLKRSESLERAGESEQASPSADQQVAQPSATCPNASQQPASEAAPAPQYYQLGLSLELTQYGIGKRKLGVKISEFSNGEVTPRTVPALHRADVADALPRGEPGTRDPLKLQPPAGTDGAPEPFLGEITEKKNRLKVGPAIEGYELVKGGADKLNGLIGRALAIHVQRSGILKPNGSGNFRGTMLGQPEPGLNATEVLGIKLYVFLRAQVDDKTGAVIHELVNGEIGAKVAQADYDKRKLIDANTHQDDLGGQMPLVPGVYQIYVLLEDRSTGQPGSGGFELAEVHCDGDPLYTRT